MLRFAFSPIADYGQAYWYTHHCTQDSYQWAIHIKTKHSAHYPYREQTKGNTYHHYDRNLP